MTFLFCVCSAGTSTNYLLLASSCQVYKLWFLVVQTCAVFDDLFPALPCFGQETRRAQSRSSRLLPELPAPLAAAKPAHLAKKYLGQGDGFVPYLEFSAFGLFVLTHCHKKRWIVGLLTFANCASFQFQISTSDAVGTRFMQPTARGKCLILLRWISTATRILKCLF